MRADLGRRCIRTEETERLAVADLRRAVVRFAHQVQLEDGTLLQLCWREVRGVFSSGSSRGTGITVVAKCPSCGAHARVLRKVSGQRHWGCRSCINLIYTAQRRSGGHKGRVKRKPVTWRLAAISDEQRHIAKLLGLTCWPPQAIAWERSQLMPGRRLQPVRIEALMDRIDALENLRVMICGIAISNRFAIGPAVEPRHPLLAAKQILASTHWAIHENWRRSVAAPSPGAMN